MRLRSNALFFLVLAICLVASLGTVLVIARRVRTTLPTDRKTTTPAISNKLERLADSPYRKKHYFTDLRFVSESEAWLLCDTSLWHTANTGQSWEKVWDISESRHSLYQFSFLSPLVGWKYSLGELAKTVNGGRTWESVKTPPTQGQVIQVYFRDENHGWIAGSVYRYFSPKSPLSLHTKSLAADDRIVEIPAVFYSADGGETWQQQKISGGFDQPNTVSNNLTFKGEKFWMTGGVRLFYLEAETWVPIDYARGNCPHDRLVDSAGIHGNKGDGVAPVNISFADDKIGWLVFPNGYLAKTTDGGFTWCDLFQFDDPQDKDKSFVKVYFQNAKQGWGLDNKGALYESGDGGATWSKIEASIKVDDIYFLDSNHGWAVAKDGLFSIKG